MCRPRAIVEKRTELERSAWRCALHQVAILRDIPCTLVVRDPVILKEVLGRWCQEQKVEVDISVLGCKCTCDESVNEVNC